MHGRTASVSGCRQLASFRAELIHALDRQVPDDDPTARRVPLSVYHDEAQRPGRLVRLIQQHARVVQGWTKRTGSITLTAFLRVYHRPGHASAAVHSHGSQRWSSRVPTLIQ
jgi:hypothetical protein